MLILYSACGSSTNNEPANQPSPGGSSAESIEDGGEVEASSADAASPVDDAPESSMDVNNDDLSDTEVSAASDPVLLINEVVAAAQDGGYDWIELYVQGDAPVDLSDYTLVDDNPDHSPVALPAVSLEPGEFFVILAVDEDDEVFAPSVPFKLGGDDGVWLAKDGETLDSLDWDEGDAPEGSSWGRLPDGDDAVARLTPTPGAENVAWDGTEAPTEPEPCDLFPQDRVMTISIEMNAEAWQAILANPMDEEYQEATLSLDGVAFEQIAVRTKGNSSLHSVANNPNSERFSWKIDTNRYVDGQKICGLKKFNLNNGFKDPTLMREHIGYWLSTEIGLPSPRTAYADLTINGQHLGLYTLVEHVDSEFIER